MGDYGTYARSITFLGIKYSEFRVELLSLHLFTKATDLNISRFGIGNGSPCVLGIPLSFFLFNTYTASSSYSKFFSLYSHFSPLQSHQRNVSMVY